MSIYLNIKTIAKKKNIQQKDIAELMEVRPNTVNNWFNGNTSMKAEQIPIIAKILRVSISELFEDKLDIIKESRSEYKTVCKKCIEKDTEIFRLKEKLYETQEKYTNVIEELNGKNANRQCG